MHTATRRLEELFTAAAITLLLFMSMLSQTWVIGIATGLIVVGLVAFPRTRRLGLWAVAVGVVAAATTAVMLALR